ncbi:hypothetical protein E8E13_008334 [Curvularia kusanoi]|uniref:Uncharacterized protein n=1 Tax=Curvularia kusanoi TaxID=90978 RepID=A0A9P4TBV9_CURKU|nr:hypothetical protein E8E13_008334 [Curvularia kusanoi]
MDEHRHNEGVRGVRHRLWEVPDVQVVLWFVLLCFVAEGVVQGVRWFRGGEMPVVERRRRRSGGKEGERLRRVEEEDEDDEVNIPVL